MREWVQKAESDLTTAAHTLKIPRNCPTDAIVVHVQQCVEKYIKAVLTLHATDVPRIHDIEKLVRLLPERVLGDWPLAEQRRLTAYAVVTRYPGNEPVSIKEAQALPTDCAPRAPRTSQAVAQIGVATDTQIKSTHRL